MRACADCGCDICNRHHRCSRCDECQREEYKNQQLAQNEKRKITASRKQYKKEYNKKNKQKLLEKQNEWLAAHREKCREKNRLIRDYGTAKVSETMKKVSAIRRLVGKQALNAETIKHIETGDTYNAYK